MSQKSSNKQGVHHLVHRSGAMARPVGKPSKVKSKSKNKWSMLFVAPAWVLVSFAGANLAMYLVLWLLKLVGINLAALLAPSVLEALVAALVYILAGVIAFGVPLVFRRGKVTLETLGLARLMTWGDIGLAPIGFIAYLMLAWFVVAVALFLFPGFSPDQAQDVGFKNLTDRSGYIIAFTTLVVLAPVAEETLFRGYLYGKLRKYVPVYAAILMTSVLFGVVHMQWNVGLNVFALSIVMCSLREITGSIWAGILLHMIKNAIAFYILFVGPTLVPGFGA